MSPRVPALVVDASPGWEARLTRAVAEEWYREPPEARRRRRDGVPAGSLVEDAMEREACG